MINAMRKLHRHETAPFDELTRRRHLSAINKSLRPTRFRRSLAASAAAILLVSAGVVVATSSNSSNPSNIMGSDTNETAQLKPVDFITPIPFERTEDYVMISAEGDRAESVGIELTAVLGSSAPVVSKTDTSTTYVVPASVANQLSDQTGLTVIADTPVQSVAEQTPVPSWGLDRIDAYDVALNDSYKYVSTGAGSIIYVIDTGVYSGHSDLSGRVISGYTAVEDGNGSEDCNGHGTHVAGTAAGRSFGVAKSATVVAVRVLDCSGSGYSSSVVAGINWAVASHPGGAGVINLSLGGSANSAIDKAVADATAAGLVVVVAAGNSSADACNYSPARAATALTIGATEKSDARASYSNFGGCVDMYAPGSSITSAWISGSSSSRALSGTSMAAPHVAGLAARLQQSQPGISVSGIAQKLTEANVGSGTVAIANFVENEEPVESTTTTSETTLPEQSTTTIVAPSTTSTTVAPKPRPGNSGAAPGNAKAPGQNKSVPQPKEFKMEYEQIDDVSSLVASWIDDGTPETYSIECTSQNGRPGAEPTIRFVVERAATTLAEGRRRTTLALAPTESVRCWIVAYIGTEKSAQSNPAILIAKPVAPSPSGGNNPSNKPGNTGNSNNANNNVNSGGNSDNNSGSDNRGSNRENSKR